LGKLALLAVLVDKFIVQYFVQPSPQFDLPYPIGVRVGPNFKPGFLHQIIRAAGISTQPKSIGMQHIHMPRDQHIESTAALVYNFQH
jgi:hypothetical protein